MKKILSYLAASMLLLSLIVTTGCEDDPVTDDKLSPVLKISGGVANGDDVNLAPTGTASVTFTLEATKGTDPLQTFSLTGVDDFATFVTTGGSTSIASNSALLFGDDKEGFTWDVTFTPDPAKGDHTVDFQVTDEGGLTSSTITIYINFVAADVVSIVNDSPDHTTLKALLDLTGLDVTLAGAGPYTLFAPTDAAFGTLPAGTVDNLLANPTLAQQYLSNHVVDGTYNFADLTDQLGLVSITGTDLTVASDGTTTSINGANIESSNLQAGNGVVHVLSGVILPPGTPIDVTLTGVLFNSESIEPGTGSLDLDEGKGSGISTNGQTTPDQAEIRDMGLDCTVPAPGLNWRRQIGGFNGTELRQVDLSQVENFTFDNVAFKEEIENAFNTGEVLSSSDVINCGTGNVKATVDYTSDRLDVGDMLVASANGKFYLIRVDDIFETDNDNSGDKYEFSIKH